MKKLKCFSMLVLILGLSGCVFAQSKPSTQVSSSEKRNLPSSYALPGTKTAVVGIGIDKSGIPLETVKEVVLLPGQKAIFAGPDKFKIVFKNRKAPTKQINYESENGVISVIVPRDIVNRPEFAEEFKTKGFVRLDYAIVVNGRELDPPFIIKRE